MRIGRVPEWDDEAITDPEYVERLFYEKAGGRCERCGIELDFDKRGPRHYGEEGCWEIHHRIGRKRLQRTFEGTINPHLPLYVHILCEDCHNITRSNPDSLIEYL
jgi:hypothetical protein